MKRDDSIVGSTYGMLTVLKRDESNTKKFICLCECGKTTSTTKQRLTEGSCRSCGCMKYIWIAEGSRKHGESKGGRNSPTYQSYIAMKQRCLNPSRKDYENYGGKGITVCDRWLEESPKGYLNFVNDMGERLENTTLDRKDSKGNYCKENCRWSSKRIQSVNTDRSKSENSTSQYRGVSLRKINGRWMSRIGNGVGGYIWLGDYATENEAALAYNTKALELFGTDAKLNDV